MLRKICPVCGRANPISSSTCENEDCMESLLGVEIIDTEIKEQRSVPIQAAPRQDSQANYMRKCPDCGKVLPYRITQCQCGASLYGVPPFKEELSAPNNTERRVPTSPEQNPVSAVETETVSFPLFCLRSEDGRCRINLCADTDLIIGRTEEGAEYLADKGFVSRQHARIVARAGNIVVYNLSQTNPTLVNGKPILPNHAFELKANDLVALGAQPGQSQTDKAAYFRLVQL